MQTAPFGIRIPDRPSPRSAATHQRALGAKSLAPRRKPGGTSDKNRVAAESKIEVRSPTRRIIPRPIFTGGSSRLVSRETISEFRGRRREAATVNAPWKPTSSAREITPITLTRAPVVLEFDQRSEQSRDPDQIIARSAVNAATARAEIRQLPDGEGETWRAGAGFGRQPAGD